MGRIEKTVFISYRRTNAAWALAIYKDLTHHGYDVFFDFSGIPSGDFEQVILENIKARAHFLVLLTPSALERINEPGDWLRREIECAVHERRNIVPLFLEGFDFRAPAIARQLTGALAALRRYNGLNVPVEYFDAAMEKLRNAHLNVSLEGVLHPASPRAVDAAKTQQSTAEHAPKVERDELAAIEWLERGLASADTDEQVRCYTQALRLKPHYAAAYNNRGNARVAKGDNDGALADYTECIRLKPDALAYNNRGATRAAMGDIEGALADYKEALRAKPGYLEAYYNRGLARAAQGDYEGALADYAEVLRLNPEFAYAYTARGSARMAKGDLDGALADYTGALRLNPEDAEAYWNRGTARARKGDHKGARMDRAHAVRLRPDLASVAGGGRRSVVIRPPPVSDGM